MSIFDYVDSTTPVTQQDAYGQSQPLDQEQENASRVPQNIITKGLDLLSRLSYGSAKFQDVIASRGMSAIGDALSAGYDEILNPVERLNVTDLLDRYVPEFGESAPFTKEAVGFLLTAATDPLTWGTIGTGSLPKIGLSTGKEVALSGAGQQLLKKTAEALMKSGDVGHINLGEFATKFIKDSPEMITRMKAYKGAQKYVADAIEAGATELIDKGGIKFAGVYVPGSAPALNAIGKVTGINKMREYVGSMRGVNSAKYFEKLFPGQGKAFEEFRKNFNRHLDNIETDANNIMLKLGKEVDKAAGARGEKVSVFAKTSRDKIKNMMADVEDATKNAARKIKEYESNPMFTEEVIQPWETSEKAIFDHFTDVYKKNHNLSQSEFDAAVGLRANYNKQYAAELELGIVKEGISQYDSRLYDKVEDVQEFLTFRQFKETGMLDFLPAAVKKKFDILEPAEMVGKEPLMDAFEVAGIRTQDSMRRRAMTEFNAGVKKIFNVESMKDLPPEIARELRYIGDATFSWFGNSHGTGFREVVKGYDTLTSIFKKMATVVKPAFAIKQQISNITQGFLEQGLKVFKAYDPRVMKETAAFMMEGNPGWEGVVDNIRLLSDNATTYNGREVMDHIQRLGVKKGTSVFTEQRNTRQLGKMMDQMAGESRWAKPIRDGLINKHGLVAGQEKFEKLMTFNGTLARYMNWAGQIEDFNRISLFTSGLRQGLSPEESASMVNKALFDYADSFSDVQKQVWKRAIPFMSFNWFASRLLGRTLTHKPGRVVNLQRGFEVFAEGIGKLSNAAEDMRQGRPLNTEDRLNADQENVLPGYLLDSPFSIKEFDGPSRASILSFNNMSLLDIMAMTEEDSTGNMDWRKTGEKFVMSQITPFIKYPLEEMLNKDFFTGRMINDPGSPGKKLGQVTPEGVLSNMAAMLAGSMDRTAGPGGSLWVAALGKAVGEPVLDKTGLDNIVKKVLGWKELPNKEDPTKTEVYINPYIAHVMLSAFPGLNTAIRADKQDLTPLERSMDLFVGTTTSNIDFKKAKMFKGFDFKNKERELKSNISKLKRLGDLDEAEALQEQLRALQEQARVESKRSRYSKL